jgi:hypothetical protein
MSIDEERRMFKRRQRAKECRRVDLLVRDAVGLEVRAQQHAALVPTEVVR